MYWCKKDQFYVCGRCWDEFCKKRHQATGADRGMSIYGISVMVACFAAFMLPFCFPGIYDYYMADSWNGMPETTVGELPDHGAVKVYGMLNSSSEIALGYIERYDDDSGYYWVWDSNARFRVQDDTGSVQVLCSHYYDIRESGQYTAVTSHMRGPIYTNTTHVTITGDIQLENGQKVLYLRTMVPGHAPLQADPWLLIPDFIAFPILFIATGYTISHARSRTRLHEEKVQGAVPSEPPADRAHKPSGVKWVVNTPPRPARNIGPLSILAFILGISLLYLGWYYFGFRKEDLYFLMFGDAMIVLFLIVAPIAVSYSQTSVLTELGTSERGIHFWYDNMGQRMLNKVFIQWSDVDAIGWLSSGKSRTWEIRLKNEEAIFPGLTARNRELLEAEWANQRAKEHATGGKK